MGRNYHHGDLKAALVATALEIVAREGLSGLTLHKAARRQGVSAAAVYRHYASKEDLLAAMAARGFDRLRDSLDEILVTHKNPRRLFRASVECYIDLALSQPNQYELMFGGAIPDHRQYPELYATGREAFERLLETVRICQRGGLFKKRKPIVMAFHVWSMMHGFVMLHLAGQNPFAVDRPAQLRRLTGLMVQFLRRGLDMESQRSHASPAP